MASLQRARTLLEESEAYSRELAVELGRLNELRKLGTHKERLESMWIARALADHVVGTSRDALQLLKEDKRENLSENNATLASFYAELGDPSNDTSIIPSQMEVDPKEIILELGGRWEDNVDNIDQDMSEEYAEQYDENDQDSTQDQNDHLDWLALKFSGEEMNGRYLDLTEWHLKWNNLADADINEEILQTQLQDSTDDANKPQLWRRQPYVSYLRDLSKFPGSHEFKLQSNQRYITYITGIVNYLFDFFSRVRPINDVYGFRKKASATFEHQWEQGSYDEWIRKAEGKPLSSHENELHNNEDQEKHPIWCSPCSRFFAKETVYKGHVNSKGHKKMQKIYDDAIANGQWDEQAEKEKKQELAAKTEAVVPPKVRRAKEIALQEHLGRALLRGPLKQIASDTLINVERRLSLTESERLHEIQDLNAREASEAAAVAVQRKKLQQKQQDDGSGTQGNLDRIHNPLQLPIGWDGNPIPYWLYKIQGLGNEFPCEICSGFVYRGRRNFERHFQESRHAYGLRALGIPNTKHFYEITKIDDARELADKLRKEGRKRNMQSDTVEELEDSQGNVYTKKIYEDMKRQGLLS